MSMKANRVHQFGSPAVIVFEDIAVPTPAAEEVLIRVKASGVGPWDAWIRSGKIATQCLPLTLGSDLSGVVEAVGDAVADLQVGDEVFGITNSRFIGANAEYAIASASMVEHKPRRLQYIEAASIPVAATMAWQMLFEHAHVAPGQRVLVLGAAGNVGAYAVQLARLVRAQVIATAGTGDLDYVHELGADEVIDYRVSRFDADLDAVDAVIDTVGGEMQARSFAVVRPGGMLVSSVSPPDAREAERTEVRTAYFLVSVTSPCLAKLASMFDAGELQASIGSVLPLAEARAAHEMLDGMRSRPRGKIVLRTDN